MIPFDPKTSGNKNFSSFSSVVNLISTWESIDGGEADEGGDVVVISVSVSVGRELFLSIPAALQVGRTSGYGTGMIPVHVLIGTCGFDSVSNILSLWVR